MIAKLLLILSIAANTLGITSVSSNIDRSIIAREVNPTIKVQASSGLILPEIPVKPKIKADAPKLQIYAKSHILIDADSSIVLNERKSEERLPIASTTKIMTAVLVLENLRLNDTLTVSANAAKQIGVDLQTKTGEQATVESFLKLLLVNSSNRAAFALAENFNTTSETGIDKFVGMMNAKARELGLEDTHYMDPAGLDVTGYSSSYDLALLTKYALKDPVFASIVKIKEETVTDLSGKIKYELKNSNRLVREWDYPGAIGVKTGYMPEASHCLVAAAVRDGHTLVSVVLGTNVDSVSASAEESRKLLNWGFTNTIWE